jgi:hypothetical protein
MALCASVVNPAASALQAAHWGVHPVVIAVPKVRKKRLFPVFVRGCSRGRQAHDERIFRVWMPEEYVLPVDP